MKIISRIIFTLSFTALLSAALSLCPDICEKCDGPFGDQCIECKPKYFAENGICKPCHDSCSRCTSPFKSDCLPESLYAILNTQRVLSTGDTTQPANGPATLSSGYNLYYEFKNNTIDLLLQQTAGSGWFAIGLGTQMNGADMIICLPSSPSITCSQYTGGNEVTPTIDSGQYLQTLGYDISGSAQIVKLNRALNTSDPGDKVIVDGANNMIWAYHASATHLVQHTSYGIEIVTLSSSGNSTTIVVNGNGDTLEKVHGILMFLGWGLAVDFGLIFMAIGRKYPFYIILHSLTMWFTTISTIVVVALLLNRGSVYGSDTNYNAHYGIGLTILGLMILQHIGGLIVITKSKRKNVSTFFYRLRLMHRVTGMLLYILAKANIFIGTTIHNSGQWNGWIIPIEVILIVLNILVRIWMKYRGIQYHPLVSKVSRKLTNQQLELISAISNGKTREELMKEFPKMKFGYLFNRIYDLSFFEHPGGDFILSEVTGREIGRFLYGAYHLEKIKGKPFKHATTDIAILNRYFIGDISQGEKSILVDKQGKSAITNDFENWRFVGKKALTTSTACFEFQNVNYQIKNDLQGVSWIGRHFYLSKDLVHGPTRPYTVCNSLGESWTEFRRAAIEFFDSKMQDDMKGISAELPTLANNLNFVIKHYENSNSLALSDFLHKNLKPSENVLINGPVGRGLEITDDAKGTHYAFAIGTGILPFMDLINFLLFKSMYLALKLKFGPEIAQQLAKASHNDYETPLSGSFKLVLVAAYASSSENIGFEIVRKTAEINSKFNLGLFEAHVKGAPNDQYVQNVSRIDELFIKERVGKDAAKFLICGSPAFNKQFPQALAKMSFDSKKISMV